MTSTAVAANIWESFTLVGGFRADTPHTCANCGQGILNVVTVQDSAGAKADLGLDCADRVGLSTAGVRAMLRDKYAGQRASWAAENAARRAEWKAEEDAESVRRSDLFRGLDITEMVEDECLYTTDGEPVPAKTVRTRYGWAWMLLDGWGGESNGEWFSPSKAADEDRARKANAKKGYYVGEALFPGAGPAGRMWADRDETPVAFTDNGQV